MGVGNPLHQLRPIKLPKAAQNQTAQAKAHQFQFGSCLTSNSEVIGVTAEPRGVNYIEVDAAGVPAMCAVPKNCAENRDRTKLSGTVIHILDRTKVSGTGTNVSGTLIDILNNGVRYRY